MKKRRRNMAPADFNADLEKKFQIYARPYMGFTDLGCLLDVSPKTAKRMVEDMNRNSQEPQIRSFQRIGMPTVDIVKAFGLEANRTQIVKLRAFITS